MFGDTNIRQYYNPRDIIPESPTLKLGLEYYVHAGIRIMTPDSKRTMVDPYVRTIYSHIWYFDADFLVFGGKEDVDGIRL